jgi:hypothetical protein
VLPRFFMLNVSILAIMRVKAATAGCFLGFGARLLRP